MIPEVKDSSPFLFDLAFNQAKKAVKKETRKTLEEPISEFTGVLNDLADTSIESTSTPLVKKTAQKALPQPLADSVTRVTENSLEPVSKNLIHASIENSLDKSTKSVINQTMDYSTQSITNIFSSIYNYISENFS